MDGLFAVVSLIVMLGIVAFLVWSMVKSIRDEQRSSGIRRVWANFGLSLVLCGLFLVSWGTQAFAQWENFRNEQRSTVSRFA
jgi:hypothetical protein